MSNGWLADGSFHPLHFSAENFSWTNSQDLNPLSRKDNALPSSGDYLNPFSASPLSRFPAVKRQACFRAENRQTKVFFFGIILATKLLRFWAQFGFVIFCRRFNFSLEPPPPPPNTHTHTHTHTHTQKKRQVKCEIFWEIKFFAWMLDHVRWRFSAEARRT